MKHLGKFFKKYPVIPEIRDMGHLNKAMDSKAVAVFLLTGSILEFDAVMTLAHEKDKLLFINVDLVSGIEKNGKGIEYLIENDICDGIITTQSNLINIAKEADLMTIQRVFIQDNSTLKEALNLLKTTNPDAVEISPAIAETKAVEHLKKLNLPIIVGSFDKEKETVKKLIERGILAISSSEQRLWG